MPAGKVKWYDAGKGFGFLSQPEGEDVYVHTSALPDGVTELTPGQHVEFDMASGRRGPQALRVSLSASPPSVQGRRPARREAAAKHTPEELHGMIEDMITLLDSAVQPELRKGRLPERKIRHHVADILRAVGGELDG